MHLGSAVNSSESEWFPTVSKDGTLYFGSDRAGGKGRTDIWRSKLVNGKYGQPENLGDAINSPASEVEPLIAADESFMIFAAAGRAGGQGAFDLYVSHNRDGVWTKAENLGEKINSSAWDFSPKISPDGKYFFFTSNRGFADQPWRSDELQELIGNSQAFSTACAIFTRLVQVYKADALNRCLRRVDWYAMMASQTLSSDRFKHLIPLRIEH